jgi:hypothetical protein
VIVCEIKLPGEEIVLDSTTNVGSTCSTMVKGRVIRTPPGLVMIKVYVT